MIFVLSAISPKSYAQQFVPVQGEIFSQRVNGPAPGLTVFLVHQFLGKSLPSFSDANGRFGWIAIPVSEQQPYFLEIYWDQNLIYRQPIQITSPTTLPKIIL